MNQIAVLCANLRKNSFLLDFLVFMIDSWSLTAIPLFPMHQLYDDRYGQCNISFPKEKENLIVLQNTMIVI